MCYKAYTSKRTYAGSHDNCQADGARLFRIDSPQKQEFTERELQLSGLYSLTVSRVMRPLLANRWVVMAFLLYCTLKSVSGANITASILSFSICLCGNKIIRCQKEGRDIKTICGFFEVALPINTKYNFREINCHFLQMSQEDVF